MIVSKVFKDLGSSDTVKNVAFAAVTAGATEYAGNALGYLSPSAGGDAMYTTQQGANTSINIMDQATSTLSYGQQAEKVLVNASVNSAAQTAIYGGNLGTNFTDSLKTGAVYAVGADAANIVGGMYNGGNGSINEVTHLTLHAGIGCAIGAGTSGNCGAGAIGGAVSEGVADLNLGSDKQSSAQIGQYAALGTALVAGIDAKGIYTANGTAVNALQNNFLMPTEKEDLLDKLVTLKSEKDACTNQSCTDTKQASMDKVQADYQKISNTRDSAYKIAALKCASGDCEELDSANYTLRMQANEVGNQYYTEHSNEFTLLPKEKSIYHSYPQDSESGKIDLSGQLDYQKYVHPTIGYEVVIDNTGKIVTDSLNMGTYNFYNPSLPGVTNSLLSDDAKHVEYDIAPYILRGNAQDDPTNLLQRSARYFSVGKHAK